LTELARKEEPIEVTTMTSSKPLEFDVALIIGTDEENNLH
jgi:hypothetical protein